MGIRSASTICNNGKLRTPRQIGTRAKTVFTKFLHEFQCRPATVGEEGQGLISETGLIKLQIVMCGRGPGTP